MIDDDTMSRETPHFDPLAAFRSPMKVSSGPLTSNFLLCHRILEGVFLSSLSLYEKLLFYTKFAIQNKSFYSSQSAPYSRPLLVRGVLSYEYSSETLSSVALIIQQKQYALIFDDHLRSSTSVVKVQSEDPYLISAGFFFSNSKVYIISSQRVYIVALSELSDVVVLNSSSESVFCSLGTSFGRLCVGKGNSFFLLWSPLNKVVKTLEFSTRLEQTITLPFFPDEVHRSQTVPELFVLYTRNPKSAQVTVLNCKTQRVAHIRDFEVPPEAEPSTPEAEVIAGLFGKDNHVVVVYRGHALIHHNMAQERSVYQLNFSKLDYQLQNTVALRFAKESISSDCKPLQALTTSPPFDGFSVGLLYENKLYVTSFSASTSRPLYRTYSLGYWPTSPSSSINRFYMHLGKESTEADGSFCLIGYEGSFDNLALAKHTLTPVKA